MHAGVAPRHQPSQPASAMPVEPREFSSLVRENFSFVWRSLRRFGLEAADADDAAQQVFLVLSNKLNEIAPGKERAFLFGTAMRVASRAKRSQLRRREAGEVPDDLWDSAPGPDETIDRRRAQEQLTLVLEPMSEEIRAVFILYEFEQLTMAEISELLGVVPGTVASRLRRGRELWAKGVERLQARLRGIQGEL